jgi:hypothetical protein
LTMIIRGADEIDREQQAMPGPGPGKLAQPAGNAAAAELDEVGTAWRHRWNLTPAERGRVKRRMLQLATVSEDERTNVAASKILVEMAARDQDDVHHIEGSRVTLEIDRRTPAEKFEELKRVVAERLTGKVGASAAAGRRLLDAT